MTCPKSTTCHAYVTLNNPYFSSIYTFPVHISMQSSSCHRSTNYPATMKISKETLLWELLALLLHIHLDPVSGIQVREPETETDVPVSLKLDTNSLTSPAATGPEDNGMAVGEAPEVELLGSSIAPEIAIPFEASPSPVVDAVFPENHKNFSASTYLGTIESPPYLESYNKYQQQYREYYAQKSQYAATANPIRFQDNPHVPSPGISAFGDDSNNGNEVRQRNKLFPYPYETNEPVHYPIPNLDDVSTTEESQKDTKVTPSSLFPSFSDFAFPLSNLFGKGSKHGGSDGSPTRQSHHHSYHSQGQRSEVAHKHKSNGSWKKILKVLSTVVPFGLFLATLTPNLLYINTTEDNRPSRLRSLDGMDGVTQGNYGLMDPLVKLAEQFGGLESMEDPQCEDRFFCEMSVLGKKEESNFIEKGFWYLANETPDDIAQDVGMRMLFQAIRNGTCDIYNCKSTKSEVKTQNEEPILVAPSKVNTNELKKEGKKPKKFKKFVRT